MDARNAWRLTVVCAVLVAGLLVYPGFAYSQGNIELGPFRILTSLDLSGQYNDNILLAPRDETSDFIWVISPGVTIELPGRRSALRLGYRADVVRYVDNDTLDTVDHTIQADATANFAGGLNLRLSDEFRRTQQFPGFPVPELTTIVDRNENVLQAGAEYAFAQRYSLGVDYRFFWVDYDGGPLFDELDRQDHLFGVALFYRIQPKTSILGEYNYQMIRYDLASDRDSDAHAFKVGVKGDFTAKTSALVKVGAQFRNYDNPARPDFEGLIVEAELIYKYREPSQVRLYGGRGPIESTFELNNFFTATYGGIEVRHYITPALIARARGLYGVNDYPTAVTIGNERKERSDDFLELGAAIRYQIRRWVSVELEYVHLSRDSNFADFDYTNNRVAATVRLTY